MNSDPAFSAAGDPEGWVDARFGSPDLRAAMIHFHKNATTPQSPGAKITPHVFKYSILEHSAL